MNNMLIKSCIARLTLSVMAVGAGAGTAMAAEPVKMGYNNWADVMAVANVAKYVLETKLKQPVQLVNADIGIQFQGVARGNLDVLLGGWLPVTHDAYYQKHKNDLDDIGVIYSGGKNGWAVPAYVPESEVSSIADLAKPEVKSKMNGTIQGIEPGSGVMRAAEQTVKDYNLAAAGYKLQSASEAGMLATLSRGYPSKQWMVVTAWSPHWMFQKWNMRYLKDPKGSQGGEEKIHAFGSKQFAAKFPQVHAFIKNFKLDLADVESIEQEGYSTNNYEAAAKKFVDAHPEKLKAWLPQ